MPSPTLLRSVRRKLPITGERPGRLAWAAAETGLGLAGAGLALGTGETLGLVGPALAFRRYVALMGVYPVSVTAQYGSQRGEDGYGDVAAALNTELERRRLPAYELPQAAAEAQDWFEEKADPSMDSFLALCRTQLTDAELPALLDWTVLVLVPCALEEEIVLPVATAHAGKVTIVAGAPRVLTLTERLADAIELSVDAIPAGANVTH